MAKFFTQPAVVIMMKTMSRKRRMRKMMMVMITGGVFQRKDQACIRYLMSLKLTDCLQWGLMEKILVNPLFCLWPVSLWKSWRFRRKWWFDRFEHKSRSCVFGQKQTKIEKITYKPSPQKRACYSQRKKILPHNPGDHKSCICVVFFQGTTDLPENQVLSQAVSKLSTMLSLTSVNKFYLGIFNSKGKK